MLFVNKALQTLRQATRVSVSQILPNSRLLKPFCCVARCVHMRNEARDPTRTQTGPITRMLEQVQHAFAAPTSRIPQTSLQALHPVGSLASSQEAGHKLEPLFPRGV